MKEGWNRMTLGEIATKMADGPFGSNLKAAHYTDKKEVRIIQLSNIGEDGWREDNTKYTTFSHLETISRSEVFPNDIVIAKMMPAGRAIICPNKEKKYVLSSDAVKVCLKDGYNSRFICFQINSAPFREQVYENVSGSGRVRTSLTKLRDCFLCIPPLPEQQRIVEYLDSTFAEIDALKAKAAEEVANAKAMFDAALREEMTPKEGWEEKTLGEIADVKGGKRVPKGYQLTTIPTKHKYIRVADFNDNGSINVDDLLYITDEIFEQIKRYTITSEDVYISIAGTIGKSGIIPKELDGANLTENACKLVLKPVIDKVFVYLYTLSSLFKEQIMQYTKTSAQPKLALTRLANVIIYYPPFEQQEAIVARLDTLRTLVTTLEQKYAKIATECDALKQAILKETFE